MLACSPARLLAWLAACSPVVLAAAYVPQEAPVTASFPSGVVRSVVSEPGTPKSKVFAASSGIVYALEADSTGVVTPVLDAGSNEVQMRLGETSSGIQGFARELALTPTHVYAAASRMGIARFSRATYQRDLLIELVPASPPSPEEVWTIAVVSQPSKDLIVVGTNDDGVDGRVLVYERTATTTTLRWDYDAGKPVYTVAASDSANLAPGLLTIFAGTACGDLIGAMLDPVNWGTLLAPQYVDNLPTRFTRDLVIHAPSAAQKRLYAANYNLGVEAYNVQITITSGSPPYGMLDLQKVVGGGWPIPEGIPQLRYYCMGLELNPQTNRLVVGLGPKYSNEIQYSPGCGVPKPCMFDTDPTYQDASPFRIGMHVYTLGATGAPTKEAEHVFFPDDSGPEVYAALGGALRLASDPQYDYFVDVAAAGRGEKTIRVDLDFPVPVDEQGNWDLDNEVALLTTNEIVVIGNWLFISTEKGVLSFDLSCTSPDLLKYPNGVGVRPTLSAAGGPNTIDGFGGGDPRLYGFGNGGVSIWNLSVAGGPCSNTITPEWGGAFTVGAGQGVKGLLGRVMTGLGTAPTNPAPRWVVVPLSASGRAGTNDGSIEFWNVGYATSASDPSIQRVNTLEMTGFNFYDVAIRPVAMDEAICYATFRHQKHNGKFEAGIARFRLKMISSGGQDVLTFQDFTATVAFSEDAPPATGYNPSAQIHRITYDPIGNYLYGAFGCNGFATGADVADPASTLPVNLFDVRAFDPLAHHTVFEVGRAWGNKLYVSILDQGLGILDDLCLPGSSALTIYGVRFNGIGIEVDAADPTRRTVFLAGGNGGLDRFHFPAAQYP